jgi:HEAT repeat protein
MGDNAGTEANSLADLDDLALVGRALATAPNLRDDSDEDDEYWAFVHESHRRGTRQIFEEASWLILSEDPQVRGVACDVLSQLGFETGQPFAAETIPLLARICTEEVSPSVLGSAISAMGHLRQPEAVPYVIAHAQHADPRVRLSVACSLPSIADGEWLGQAHPIVTTLMQLTSDDGCSATGRRLQSGGRSTLMAFRLDNASSPVSMIRKTTREPRHWWGWRDATFPR